MNGLYLLNYTIVLFFGIILSLSFSDIDIKTNKLQCLLLFICFSISQLILLYIFGSELLFKSYPFVIHLPLFFLLKYYYKKNTYISAISVLSAYLFCTPRKWIGTLISSFWGYNAALSYITQIAITIPLIFIILKYISPYVKRLKYEDDNILKLFLSVPLIYYIIEYILTVYTDLLYKGSPVVMEFMDSSVVVIYFIFSIIYLKMLYEKKEIEIDRTIFKIIAEQSEHEIELLRASEEATMRYRHDLRHHFSLLHALAIEGDIKKVDKYIKNILLDIDNITPNKYSNNEIVNLILSSFMTKAQKAGVALSFDIRLPRELDISDTELCMILSNGLENAIFAAKNVTNVDFRKVFIKCVVHKKNLLVFIENTYEGERIFDNILPQAQEEGHGFGTKSIASIAEKHGGNAIFAAAEGIFTLKVMLPILK